MSESKLISLLRKPVLLLLLFAVPCVIDLYLGLVVWGDLSHIDEGLYYKTAGEYLEGVIKGDTSKFLALSEHPPLAILMVGVFRLILTSIGFGNPRIVERVFGAVCLGAVSLVSYKIAERTRGGGAGFLAWILTAAQLIIVPYEFWAKGPLKRAEINSFTLTASLWKEGMAPYFQFAPMVLSTMIFMSLSVYFLIDHKDNRNLTKAGICYGLASLMNSAIPLTLLTICFLWLAHRTGLRQAVIKTLRYGVIGWIFSILGNPVFWSIGNFLFFVERFTSGEVAHTANHIYVFLKSQFWGGMFFTDIAGGDESLTVGYIVLMRITLYWVTVYIELWLAQLFLILSVFSLAKGKPIMDERIIFLAWLSVMFLFLSVMMKPTGFVEPHLDYLVPPLALYCTYTLHEHYPWLLRFATRFYPRRAD